jgi:phosphoadenosine phosphosulfate reductase
MTAFSTNNTKQTPELQINTMKMHRESVSSSPELESGYASGASSAGTLPQIVLTKAHLKFINLTLNKLSPMDILRWCKITFPNLYQTTSFGLTGLVTLDMLSKLQAESPDTPSIDAIFFDTLYHFDETHALIEKTKERYPNFILHIYKPEGVSTAAEFEAKHGKELWKTNDQLYDWVAKVEPAQRAYADLSVAATLTGRRRSQGAKRESLEIVEVDEAGLIKINPLASWSFSQVQEYIKANNIPYNALLDRGYKSVGDWHSTEPVSESEDERAGRWKGTAKTECGIHNKRSKYAQFLFEAEQKRQQEELEAALKEVQVKETNAQVALTV